MRANTQFYICRRLCSGVSNNVGLLKEEFNIVTSMGDNISLYSFLICMDRNSETVLMPTVVMLSVRNSVNRVVTV